MKHRNLESLDAGNRTRAHLATIRRYYDTALDGPRTVDESEIRGQAAPEPVSIDVLEARRDALHDLHFWCGYILDKVTTGSDGGKITTRVEPTISDMCAFISRWVDILAEQYPEDMPNLTLDAERHAKKLEALAKGWRTKRLEVGKCPEQRLIVAKDGTETFTPCTGTLWAIVRESDTILPKAVQCDQEGEHTWTPWQFSALGRRLGSSDLTA